MSFEGPNTRKKIRALPDEDPGDPLGLAGPLDGGGKIPSAQIPTIALADYLGTVSSQSAMLALGASGGDTCIRTDYDPDQVWLCLATPSTSIGNWAPVSGYVVSVNSQTGAVTLTATDVGAQPVDATLTALAGLDSTAGMVEQTGADTFTKRSLGVGASTSVLTRADGDGRYSVTSHVHAASAITNTPAGDIAATDVQAAINELDTEKQPKDATLTALAGLDSGAGLVEQTGADTFAKRALGVGASTSIPTRADADARYDAAGSAASALSSALSALTSHTSDTTDAHSATAIGYTPATSGNWSPSPTTGAGGLDQLASRVKTLETTPSGVTAFNSRTGAVSPADGDYSQSLITGLKAADSPSFVAVTSTVATGTAPLTVSSTTKVTNLNADLLDGYHASTTAANSVIPVSSGSNATIPRGFVATGAGATGHVPIQQSDGSLAMGAQTVATSGGLSGGTGVIVYEVSGAPVTLANNASAVVVVGEIVDPRVQVSIWEQGTARTNQTNTWTFSTANEASYVQESASLGTDFSTGGVYLHRTLSNSLIKFMLQGNGTAAGVPFEPFFHTLGGSGFSVSTTTPKYGSGCVNIDAGTGIQVDTTGDVPSGWGSYSWTIEAWVRFDALTGFRGVFCSNTSSYNTSVPTAFMLAMNGTSLYFFASANNSTWSYADNLLVKTGFTTGTWYHLAIDHNASNDTLHVYVDGVLEATVTSVTALYNTDKYLSIGYWNFGGDRFDGQMDDIRITIDSPANNPVYNGAGFTPPTEFTDPSFTTTGYYVYSGDALDLATARIASFDSATFTEQAMTGTQIRYLVSWDSGTTWINHSGSTVALADIHTSGSTSAQMSTYFTALAVPGGATALAFAAGLKTTDPTLSPKVTSIAVQYDETAPWMAGSPSNYQVRVWPGDAGAVEVTNVSGGSKTAYIYVELV